MKTVFFVIEKGTDKMLGAYPTFEEADFEATVFALCNPIQKLQGIQIRKKEDVPEVIFNHLMLMSLNNKKQLMVQ